MSSDQLTYADPGLPRIRFGTGWTEVTILSEVKVLFTARGYAPVLVVGHHGIEETMFVGATSLGRLLEAARAAHGSRLTGLRVRIRRAAEHQRAPYECEVLGDEPG